MSTTYTKGPWYVFHQAIGNFPWQYSINSIDGQCSEDEAAANARLIAAAPAMLEALKVARAIIDKDIDLTAADYEQISFAIAQAEGRG